MKKGTAQREDSRQTSCVSSSEVCYTPPMGKLSIFAELWSFMRVRKKWWLLPMLLLITTLGLILVFAQGSVLAPFIYTIF